MKIHLWRSGATLCREMEETGALGQFTHDVFKATCEKCQEIWDEKTFGREAMAAAEKRQEALAVLRVAEEWLAADRARYAGIDEEELRRQAMARDDG